MFNARLNTITAIVMTIVLVFSSSMLYKVVNVYADDDGEESNIVYDEFTSDEGDGGYNADAELPPEPKQQEPEQPKEQKEVDPLSYSMSCYTPNIDFGTISEGDYNNNKTFSIVNTGYIDIPLAWEVIDPYTSFILEFPQNTYLRKGDQAVINVRPVKDLKEGVYNARYVFYSGNDLRRTHSVTVTFSIKVTKNHPTVDAVIISPGSAEIAVGKSLQFGAQVKGNGDYDNSVTWSVNGQRSGNTFIDDSGKLNIATDETASTVAVIATSRQNPSRYDNVIINITHNDYMINVSAYPSEGGNVTGGGSVRDGSSIILSQSANNNYRFIGWYEADRQISMAAQLAINDVRSDMNIQARYERATCNVRVGVNNSAAGTVSGGGSVAYGGSVTLNAKANDGYAFEGYYEGNRLISASPSVQLNNVTGDMDIIASFKGTRYTVSCNANPVEGGLVYGMATYNADSKVTLEAKPNKGYDFTGWSLNGQIVSKDNKYVIDKLSNNYSFVANFAVHNTPVYKITSGIANEGGGIVPSGDVQITEGGTAVYNIVPLAGYKILAVAVDNVQVGAVSSYTFTNVKAPHTITAAFIKVETKKKSTGATSVVSPTTTVATTGTTKKSSNEKIGTMQASVAVTDDTKDESNVSSDKKPSQEVTIYNDATASQGALPDQVIVEEVAIDIPEVDAVIYEEEDVEETPGIVAKEAALGSVLEKYGLTEEFARDYIRGGMDLPLLKAAFENGNLEITVNNAYADDAQETSVAMYYDNPTLHNFEDVIGSTLTEEEKINILKGDKASFNVNISGNNSYVSSSVKKLMQKKIGYKAVEYFDLYIMKTTDSNSVLLHNIDKELEMTIKVPESQRKKGRNFYILREHNGDVDVLADLDNDPDTITFRTNRFSEYAIAYEALNVNILIAIIVGVIFLSLIVGSICFANLIRYKYGKRRNR